MAGNMLLSDGTSSVSFSPLINPGIRRPDAWTRGVHQYDGGMRQYWSIESGRQEHFSLNNVSSTNAAILNGWWQDLTILVFTPNLDGAPEATIYARLSPAGGRPFQWMWGREVDTTYEATVTIVEVSSSSSG